MSKYKCKNCGRTTYSKYSECSCGDSDITEDLIDVAVIGLAAKGLSSLFDSGSNSSSSSSSDSNDFDGFGGGSFGGGGAGDDY